MRLAVVKTLHTFMTVQSLPRAWISIPFLRLLFQNLLVEERSDIREATLTTWREVLSILSITSGWMESSLTQQVLLEWFAVLMTPLGLPLDGSSFYDPTVGADNGGPSERHNVDKNMLAQDLSLVSVEVVIQARLAASEALAHIIAFWPASVSAYSLRHSCMWLTGHRTGTTGALRRRYLPAYPHPLHRFHEHVAKVP